ncbi:sensor domain-containing diguanylate cyclase [Shewanella sp. JM162201]|uniref:Sensor domain-containing diguanylate cyclase n=1 Tax=Shewanella jiangmenensis TaxID=2837387 RepID=A0ABS5V6K4_9GAMM|nr:sensor domain-containing diguanylate cyclase [Shewanella jiangmenensis]MBT1445598.1 sensor domain-containing diguanylate cyclase [Shewanella jiangmenensis]
MFPAPIPVDELARLDALRGLNILDTEAEERFDRITRLARRLLDVPICLVSLVDAERQWFKSCLGLSASETRRDISFCGHAIMQPEIFVVEDALADERFCDNPLVVGDPNIRFYAGYPLTLSSGYRVGTLCVIDRRPRQLSADDLKDLEDLGKLVVSELESVQTATLDVLTGLSNLRGFEMLARQTLAKCVRESRDATLFFFDLDHFKDINDRFGHPEGNEALRRFATVLKEAFREYDVVARIGGDEFAALVSHEHNQSPAVGILGRLHLSLGRENLNPVGYQLAYSTGTARFNPEQPQTLDELLKEADAHMFRDKNARRQAAPGNSG